MGNLTAQPWKASSTCASILPYFKEYLTIYITTGVVEMAPLIAVESHVLFNFQMIGSVILNFKIRIYTR